MILILISLWEMLLYQYQNSFVKEITMTRLKSNKWFTNIGRNSLVKEITDETEVKQVVGIYYLLEHGERKNIWEEFNGAFCYFIKCSFSR